MKIHISPVWYKSFWAYVIYTLLIATGILKLYRFNLSRQLSLVETKKTKELDELKSKMYTNITHEFRTPLTVILGMTQNLKKNLKSTISVSDKNSLSMIQRNGESLLEMVNEMLDLAKIESNSMELNLMQTDVIPFVKYLSESFHSLAETKKIKLTIYSEVDSLEMDIDVNKMVSIISNLLSNAIKFTENTGKIVVHLNKIELEEAEFLVIKVQDNGIGLAEEDIAHLFDRFYQVNSPSTKQEGTGIGLSLIREFVRLMNGTISVESTLGKGSTFTVQIPITNTSTKTEEAKITIKPSIKASAAALKKEPLFKENTSGLPLVLIIEDNVDVAHYLKTCLKGKYQTVHAGDGIIGIEMAFEDIPDIIISDVMMPGKDGFEVCATLKTDERTDHIPIILLTAKVTTEDRLAGLSHGADAYLSKPFNPNELFTRLDQLILVRKKLIRKIEKNGFSSLLKEKVENPQTKFLKQVIESHY
jgi:signal transduction histidine kinase/DNA-binding NarL/FixJ family response regulator